MTAGSEAVSTTDWVAVNCPPVGLALTVGATVSITSVVEAVDTLPAGSVPLTVNRYAPSGTAVLYVVGDVHAAKASGCVCSTSEHRNVVPALSAMKLKVGLFLLDGLAGWPVTVTTGATVSMVKPVAVAKLTLPAASTPSTLKTYSPSGSGPGAPSTGVLEPAAVPYVAGVVQLV